MWGEITTIGAAKLSRSNLRITARHEAIGNTLAYLNHSRELDSPHPNDRRRHPAAAASDTNEKAYKVVWTNLARAFQAPEETLQSTTLSQRSEKKFRSAIAI